MAKNERHKLARTTVDVYRLFKVRDAALVLSQSPDPVIAAIGIQVRVQANEMLKDYCEKQGAVIRKLKASTARAKVRIARKR